MDERTLLKLSITCSIIGIMMLYFVSQSYGPEEMKIGDIGKDDIGKIVSIEGQVVSKYYNGRHMFLEVYDDTGKINAVIFEKTIDKKQIDHAKITEGSHIRIDGRINLYKRKLEIIGDDIVTIT